MVAKINIPKDLMKALNYNEQKVQKGQAECIAAGNYLRAAHQLTFEQKLRGFELRNGLNDRATTKTLHISLNFDPSEKLSKEKLSRIAGTYFEKIGFSAQPYLVYEHRDAGHPHVHIVTTTIRSDGSRIPTHNIGRSLSEKARKEIEEIFGLVKAENGKRLVQKDVGMPQKKVYGKVATKEGITQVLHSVINDYSYTNLEKLNAVLRGFGVMADGGKENGRIHRHKGLQYRMLDAAGKQTGVPIKASAIEGRPTLAYLEKRFTQNALNQAPQIDRMKQTINEVLKCPIASLHEFRAALSARGIDTYVLHTVNGGLEGITFVDHESKCVCTNSDLGAYYSIAALQIRIQYAAQSEQLGLHTKHVDLEKVRNETTVFSDQRTNLQKQEASTSLRKEKEHSFSLDKKEGQPAFTKEKEIKATTEQREEKTVQSWELQKKRHRKNHLHLKP
jgi:hypothetical protein